MSTIAELFAARVPRYTSYPTAPHFHTGVNAETCRNWLEELDPATPLSLYLHIPFCDTLCWFCACHTTVINRYSPVTGYLSLLFKELELVAEIIGPGRTVRHIHWGGGSPTLLHPDDIHRLNAALRAHFTVAPDAEFGIEIDPRGFEAPLAETLAEVGVTRASIGVQDCDPEVQRAINRIQTIETTANAVELLRRVGIRKLNVDLVYGLPHQTVEGIERNVDAVLPLTPDRLAIFGYAHVPHFKKHQTLIPESALPGIEARFAQAEAAHARLCQSGYQPIGIDHFAKPDDTMAVAARQGRLMRNFQGYTTDTAGALIGIGASSIGSLPQGYVQNLADVPSYRKALAAGRLPIARGFALTNEDRARRAIIERLMCDLSVDLEEVAGSSGWTRPAFTDEIESLSGLADQGLVRIDGERISIDPRWRAVTRLVCAAFDAYLDNGVGRHAQAV